MAKEYVDEIEAVGKRVTDKYFEKYKGKRDELFEYTVNPQESKKLLSMQNIQKYKMA